MEEKVKKIKKLLDFEHGQPLFYSYLVESGFSSQLLQKYCKSNWLERIGPEIYKHTDKSLDPVLTIKAMQQQIFLNNDQNKDFILGAQSSLYVQGIQHYLKPINTYYIFRTSGGIVPHWRWFKTQKMYKIISLPLFKKSKELKDSIIQFNGLDISSVERALIEMAHLIPSNADYDEFTKLMELSSSLRSKLVQSLLEKCNSVRAKRVFLHVASTVNHNWYKKLDESKIDLGKGSRQIVVGGEYIKKYDICVPRIANAT